MHKAITITAPGFYGPQGRRIRLDLADETINSKIGGFAFNGVKAANYEMETSAIYGLAALLGHRACSINCIIANRAAGTFSLNPQESIDKMIRYTLDKLADMPL